MDTLSKYDLAFWKAIDIVLANGKAATSLLQRKLSIGYGFAAKLIDKMEELGIVSAADDKKARAVQMTAEEIEALREAYRDTTLFPPEPEEEEELAPAASEPTVYVLLADGFEEIEALYPIDILRRGGVPVKTVSLFRNADKRVVGAHGIAVEADLHLYELDTDHCALLFLPGGMPGAANIDKHSETTSLLTRVLDNGARVAAICAAPMVLGKRGLLAGRRAVCYPGFERFLTGATLVSDPVVTDGPITTAVGMGAAASLGLELLTLLRGKEAADRVADATFIND